MQGRLPDQKQDMLEVLSETRERLRGRLNAYPLRGTEGSVLNR